MTVFNLPDDIFEDKTCLQSPIIIHKYTALTGSFKGRSVLQRNAISLVIKGHKTMCFAEKTVEAHDQEIHFLSAGNCIVSIDLSKQTEFKSILIFFEESVLQDFYAKYDEVIRAKKCKTTQEPYISLAKDDFLYAYIQSLEKLLQLSTFSATMKQVKFEELMLYLLENYPETLLSFEGGQKAQGYELQIKKVVEQNMNRYLTIDELAFLCNVSISSFKRHFAKIYQTSPIHWFWEQRMKMAAALLCQQQAKPSEVYYQLGYENHSSFSKSFKKYYGVSPKAYQHQYLSL